MTLISPLIPVSSWCPKIRRHHVLPRQTLWPTTLPPTRRELLGPGRTKQRVLATLGRLDQLQQSGQLDALLASGARLAEHALLLTAHRDGQLPTITTRSLGPALIFDRLWQLTGCRDVITELLADRRFEFAVERAVFLTVLHRLFAPGSDRAADQWRADYLIDGTDGLQLHHLYRAMAWLGEELPSDQQQGSTHWSRAPPRT